MSSYQLPIGVSNFKKLVTYKNSNGERYLFVDKTQLILEVANDGAEVVIITRPRRFGKTLNLSMLECFYASEVDGESTKKLFENLEISKHPECMKLQGTSPVVFLSLKDVKHINYNDCIEKIKSIMSEAYKKYRKVLYSDKIAQDERPYIDAVIQKKCSVIDLENSVRELTKYLSIYFGKKAVLLIDEYDTPIQQSYVHGFYKEFVTFMRNFFGTALKENSNIQKAVLTGILRVSKESLFSDLNNVEIYSVLHEQYSEHFGFKTEEVDFLLQKTKLLEQRHDAKEWFNGYSFGDSVIYNPWSMIKFIKEKGALKSYWVNTSGNDLIRKLIVQADSNLKEKLTTLLSGEYVEEIIDENIIFSDLNKNQSAIWSLFLMSGYLKVIDKKASDYGIICKLMIPNKEIESLFKRIISSWLAGSGGISWYQTFLSDLTSGNTKPFEEKLKKIIREVISYQDTPSDTKELFYHGLMLGIVAGLKSEYKVKSNRESGKGRYDIALTPNDTSKNGVLIELKAVDHEKSLESQAKKALAQINKLDYTQEMLEGGVKNIVKMGISFSKKEVCVVSELLAAV